MPNLQGVDKKIPPCAHPRNFKQRWLVTAKLILSERRIILYQETSLISNN